MLRIMLIVWLATLLPTSVESNEPPRLTTLSNGQKFKVPQKHYHILRAKDVEAVIVDNAAVNDDVLTGHRAGYSGVAKLTHKKQPQNFFVPNYAGLNYEHIHDGTNQARDILFEPRRAPMELRVVAPNVVDLYQAPTPTWKLESVLRYEMLKDGTIEMTLECIPRAKTFRNGYIGLFWASYIHQPESLDIHFRGHADLGDEVRPKDVPVKWIRGVTPKHGVVPTHVGTNDFRRFKHDADFPLTLAFNRSKYRFTEPWYYGVSVRSTSPSKSNSSDQAMALVLMFRKQDQIRLTQSPSGGGRGNPAWDFQYFIPDYQVGTRYQMVMRAKYLPFESQQQIVEATKTQREF